MSQLEVGDVAASTKLIMTKDAVTYPTVHRPAPHNKEFPGPRCQTVLKFEKCCRSRWWAVCRKLIRFRVASIGSSVAPAMCNASKNVLAIDVSRQRV